MDVQENADNAAPTIHLQLPRLDGDEHVTVIGLSGTSLQNTPGSAPVQAAVSLLGQDGIPGAQGTPGPSLHVQAITGQRESPADFRSPKRRRVVSPAKSSVKEGGKAGEEEDTEDGEVKSLSPCVTNLTILALPPLPHKDRSAWAFAQIDQIPLSAVTG